MQPPDWNVTFEMMYDTSNYIIKAVLEQIQDNKPCEIYYASYTLDKTQSNYQP